MKGPLYALYPNDARAGLSALHSNANTATHIPGQTDNHAIPVGPNAKLLIQIVLPDGANNKSLPVVMDFLRWWMGFRRI
jgi:hypothetical protein